MTKRTLKPVKHDEDADASYERSRSLLGTRLRQSTPLQAARDPALRAAQDALAIARALIPLSHVPQSEHARVLERFTDSLVHRLDQEKPLPQQRITVPRTKELDRGNEVDRDR